MATPATVDIFENEVSDNPVAWHEISHDGYNCDYPGFGFWLCDTLLRKNPPKTIKELSEKIWKSGYAYHITPKSDDYDPEIPDPFFNMNMGPFTVGPHSIHKYNGKKINNWNENNYCAYRVIHHADGKWEVQSATDDKDRKEGRRPLVANWKYMNSAAYKKIKAADEKKRCEYEKKVKKVSSEAKKLLKALAKENMCKYDDVLRYISLPY